ncbi:MAG: transposase [Candidatus Nitrosocosmicus sp.]
MKVTADEHVHDSKVLPELVEDIITPDGKITSVDVGKLFADDGAYVGNDNFRCVSDYGILPCIKVRKNAVVRLLKTGNILRNLSVISQKNDLQGWEDSIVSYGKRWIVETLFSSIKRMFDREYVYSVKFENMVKEMVLNASPYNKMISI